MIHKAVNLLLSLQLQVKVLHWQTNSRSQHEALGEFYDFLNDAIDKFVEIYQGKYGRIYFTKDTEGNTTSTEFTDINKIDINVMLKGMEEFLYSTLPQLLNSKTDTDLLTIKDDILGELNKLKYLLSFKSDREKIV